MNGLQDITVTVEEGAVGEPSAQVLAIASEIAGQLEAWLATGETASIDLRSLPMAPGDYQALKALLGEGEVSARLEALGPSDIYETAVPGVWWLKHRNANDEVMAELIEITDCPGILRTQAEDLSSAPGQLRERMQKATVEP